MIYVIADDITGAAEMAGIALRHGQKTMLTMATPAISFDHRQTAGECDVLVIATDTRSGDAANARTTVRDIVSTLQLSQGDIIYKKTDSVLRGHIAAEIKEIMDVCHYDNALLLAQNPSKARVINNGIYYINNTPLHETDFRFDPEFPAFSSNAAELLSRGADTGNIIIADATNEAEVKAQLAKATEKTLLAGSADLFTALLQSMLHKDAPESMSPSLPTSPQKALIFCGSTQSTKITEEPYIKSSGGHEEELPMEVFLGGSPEGWFATLESAYRLHRTLIVSIGKKENGGSDCAVRLRTLMADIAKRLLSQDQPELLIIEGGATAFAILSTIGWQSFTLKSEYAPGIVSMTYGNTEILLKPGSYPWGRLFKHQ